MGRGWGEFAGEKGGGRENGCFDLEGLFSEYTGLYLALVSSLGLLKLSLVSESEAQDSESEEREADRGSLLEEPLSPRPSSPHMPLLGHSSESEQWNSLAPVSSREKGL